MRRSKGRSFRHGGLGISALLSRARGGTRVGDGKQNSILREEEDHVCSRLVSYGKPR